MHDSHLIQVEVMQIQFNFIKWQLCNMFQCADYIGLPPVQIQTLQLSILTHLVNILKLSQMQKLIDKIFRISNTLRTKKAHDLCYGNKVYLIQCLLSLMISVISQNNPLRQVLLV